MKTRFATVTANAGPQPGLCRPAEVVLCDDCESDQFYLLIVGPNDPDRGHFHLQCTLCGMSYCQGLGHCNLLPAAAPAAESLTAEAQKGECYLD